MSGESPPLQAPVIITHPDCLAHRNCTPGHPESAERLEAVMARLRQRWPTQVPVMAPLATVAQIERAHAAGYVAALARYLPEAGCVSLDQDTGLSPRSLVAARRAAGAGVLAVEKGLAGVWQRVFCAVRPPGHHAERGRPMGFCLINHVAVAACHARALGCERVAIVDFDVHHGNGTEDIVAGMPGIRLLSCFQHPFYPDRGVPPMADNCVSVPLPAGTDDTAFRQALSAPLEALAAWQPTLVLVSAGFDGHVRDPLGGWALTDAGYAWLGRRLAQLTDGALISFLEGGYEPTALAESVEAYLIAQL